MKGMKEGIRQEEKKRSSRPSRDGQESGCMCEGFSSSVLTGEEKENGQKDMSSFEGGIFMKRILVLVAVALMAFSVVAIAAPKTWVVGFSQIGSESEWRTADTISVQNAFNDDPSFILIYSDAQQKQENQIKALRSFIARKVNCIVFTALVETGYGPVLAEAKKAGIPVIMIDRDVAAEDRALRMTIMGSDFVKEGGSFIGNLELSLLLLVSTGKSTFFMPEQLTFNKRRRNCRAINSNKSFAFSAAVVVNNSCKKLLARSALSRNKHRGIRTLGNFPGTGYGVQHIL